MCQIQNHCLKNSIYSKSKVMNVVEGIFYLLWKFPMITVKKID